MPNNSRKKSGVWKGVAIFLAIVIVLGAAYVTPSAILNKWNPADWFTPAKNSPRNSRTTPTGQAAWS